MRNEIDNEINKITIIKQQEKIDSVLKIIDKINISSLPITYKYVFTEIKQTLEKD